jgi:DNA transposition AAA+ family ATPase
MSDQELLLALQEYRHENLLSLKEIAAQLDVSEATLSQLLSGKYGADTSRHLRKIREWLIPKIKPETIDVVRTETFESLIAYFERAYQTHGIYAFTGKSGFGKTVACKYYSKWRLRAIYIGGRVSMGPKNLMQEIITAAKIRTKINNSVYDLQNSIAEYMRLRSALLIVDEADKLNIRSLDALRELYDSCPMGLVLIGEPNLQTKMLTPDRNGLSLDRLYSRVDEFVSVDEITYEDMIAFLKQRGIGKFTSRDGLDYLIRRINKRGGYRTLSKIAERFRADYATGDAEQVMTKEILAQLLAVYPA